MRSVFLFELHKLTEQRFVRGLVIAAALLSFAITLLTLYKPGQDGFSAVDEYREYLLIKNVQIDSAHELEPGKDLSETVQRIQEEILLDPTSVNESDVIRLNILQKMLRHSEVIASWPAFHAQVQSEASRRLRSSMLTADAFSKRSIEITRIVYQNVDAEFLAADYDAGVFCITQNAAQEVMRLFFVLLICMQTILPDYIDGTWLLISCTACGSKKIIAAKTMAVLTGTACVTGVTYAAQFFSVCCITGLGNPARSIQSLEGFQASPFVMSVGTYLFVWTAVGLGTYLILALLMTGICIVTRNTALSIGGFGALTGLSFLLHILFPTYSRGAILGQLGLWPGLFSTSCFSDYQLIPLLEMPISLQTCGILAAAISFAAGVLLIVLGEKRDAGSAGKQSVHRAKWYLPYKSSGKCRRYGVRKNSRQAFELRKILFSDREIVVVLLAACVLFGMIAKERMVVGTDEFYYRRYCEKLSVLSLAKANERIEEERLLFESLEEKEENLQLQYRNGEITQLQMEEGVAALMSIQRRQEAFSRVEKQMQQVWKYAEQGLDVRFVYQTPWIVLMGASGMDRWRWMLAIIHLTIIFSAASVGARERESGVQSLVRCSAVGEEKVKRTKMLIFSMMGCLAATGCVFARVLHVCQVYGSWDPFATSYSITEMHQMPGGFSLWMIAAISMVGMYAVIILTALAVTAIAERIRKRVPVMGVCSALFVLPWIISIYLLHQ